MTTERDDLYRLILSRLSNLSKALDRFGMSYGELRGIFEELAALTERLAFVCPSSMKEIFEKELHEKISFWCHELKKYKPEDIVRDNERNKLLEEISMWERVVRLSWELDSSIAHIINYLSEMIENISVISKLDWSWVRKRLLAIIGYVENIKAQLPGCEEVQELLDMIRVYYADAEKKSGELQQRDADRLAGLVQEWRHGLEGILDRCRRPLPMPPLRPPEFRIGEILLQVDVAGETFNTDLESFNYLIMGRYDPGGRDPPVGGVPDGLKIKDDKGNILKVFGGVKCRWYCPPEDLDCTHREHVKVEIRDRKSGIIRVRLCENAILPVYYGFSPNERRKLEGNIELSPGRRLYLWISGVYADAKRKKDPMPVELQVLSAARQTLVEYR